MKRILAAAALILVTSASIFAADRRVVVPLNVSLVPIHGLSRSVTVVNNVQVNVGVGYADELRGIAAGVVSIIGHDVYGVQTNVVNVAGGAVHGTQIGVTNLARYDVDGPQVGVVNATLGAVKGPQIGVVNYSTRTTVQTGVVNVAGNASGIQAGVVNVAVRNSGAPIGLVNIVLRDGMTHAQTWVDETGIVNVGFIHGSKITYNIYTAGTDVDLERLSMGFGLGVHLGSPQSWVNIEAIGSSVSSTDDVFGTSTSLFRARVYSGHRFGPASLIAGASFNYLMDLDDSSVHVAPLHGYKFPFSTARHHFWPGAFVGVQF